MYYFLFNLICFALCARTTYRVFKLYELGDRQWPRWTCLFMTTVVAGLTMLSADF